MTKKIHHYNNHGIQELIRHFGKKVHHWRSEGGYGRRNSCSEDGGSAKEEEFRGRSKSLDGASKRTVKISDCEATYRIYDSILKEGDIFILLKFRR